MFEKEAEEYVRKIRHDVINWGGKEPAERFYNEIKFKQAYLAGAEFGYNKAKDENAELKEQIEKMKCCENCRYYSRTYGHCYSYDEYQSCTSLSNWSLAE